jgi:hypothetical protein
MYRAMYSMDGASSHVSRKDCASMRAFSMSTRASAVKPAKAIYRREGWDRAMRGDEDGDKDGDGGGGG